MKSYINRSGQEVKIRDHNYVEVLDSVEYLSQKRTSDITRVHDFSALSRKSPVIIYDTEFTAWPGSAENAWSREGEYREIIQIGALCMDFVNKREVRRMNLVVKPAINPQLSEYIIELTGVTQGRLDNEGIPFADAIAMLHEFSNYGEYPLMSYGRDFEVLLENARLSSVVLSKDFDFYNLAPMFRALGVDTKKISSGLLHKHFGLDQSGSTHDALYDASSLAMSLKFVNS